MTQLDYVPKGVCSRMISVEIDGGTIESVDFIGGCDGNLKGIAKLVAGRSVDEVIGLLEGNTCGMKSTSCADQLTRALRIACGMQAQEV
ncbi:MAG: TIGR03905 family TSCPD domain-containing protein [Actinobacteria bacterium]|nr:TIGR03905 family TSCPD domain-containing protein [Actinomycetota bacterium]